MTCDCLAGDKCDGACEARVTWTPDPACRYTWPSGRSTGPGLKLISDGQGGGTLFGRSKTTLRWVVVAVKKPHSAGEPT